MKPFFARCLATTLLALHSIAGNAIGFGELGVLSGLGRPLHAEIAIVAAPGEHVEAACFRVVAGSAGDGDIPRIANAKVTIREDGSSRKLVLSTTNLVREPLMLMTLRIACGVELVREFTLLFSPDERVASPVAKAQDVIAQRPAASISVPTAERAAQTLPAVRLADGTPQTPRSMARSLYPDDRRMQRRFAEALIEANPALDLFTDTPIPATAALILPDMRNLVGGQSRAAPPLPPVPATRRGQEPASTAPKPPPRVPPRRQELRLADRVMVSGGEPVTVDDAREPLLRMSTELGARPAPPDSAGGEADFPESARELLRIEYRALTGIGAGAWSEAVGEERRRLIRESATEFRRLADTLDRSIAPPSAATDLSAPAVAPSRPAPTSEPAKAPAAPVSSLRSDLLLLAVALSAAAGLAWFFIRRRRLLQDSYSYEIPAAAPESDMVANNIFREQVANAIPVATAIPSTAADEPAVASPEADKLLASKFAAPPTPVPAPPRSPATPADLPQHRPDIDGLRVDHDLEEKSENIIELADIMLAFGRVKGAIDLLNEFIASNPRDSLQPWMKLLDIHRENDQRQEFENLSLRLNKTFNIEVQVWNTSRQVEDGNAAAEARTLSLADFPHIRSEIERLWGTAGGIEYLKGLIHDNRNGERSGFRREVAEEILFLHDVLINRLKGEPAP